MTEKLYYTDSHIFDFTAKVMSCEKAGAGWAVALDRTAFFPEGGGQPADTGSIGPARVTDVQERSGRILHYTDAYLPEGSKQPCALDRERRLRHMQNHSGEHVVSGLAHSMYGVNNVGFHMGAESVTVDFDGFLTEGELTRLETLANEAAREDRAVRTFFPTGEELDKLSYRSKLELTENVRIVEIEGIDRCACCAPHVSRTGEIGLIKLLDAQRHRGGVRIELVCGVDALEECRARRREVTELSHLLSAPVGRTAEAAERVMCERDALKRRAALLSRRTVELMAAAEPYREGSICVFDRLLDETALRELANLLSEKCSCLAAVFFPAGEGWRYIIASGGIDLREHADEINSGISGRGGGSAAMIQGQAHGGEREIRDFILNYSV